jgi:hypothetical protein
MAKYLDLSDCIDPALVVTASHLADADVYVDLQLNAKGIVPADVTLPNTTLTALAVAWAKRQAAIEGAIGENSPLIDKARQLEKTAATLAALLTREALGLANAAGVAYGQIRMDRG